MSMVDDDTMVNSIGIKATYLNDESVYLIEPIKHTEIELKPD